MPLCNLVCGIIILLLIVAGIAYLLGADSLGEFALDVIRLIIILALIILLIGLILIIIGYVSWQGLPFIIENEFEHLLVSLVQRTTLVVVL